MAILRLDQLGLSPAQGAAFERDLDAIRERVYEDKIPPRTAFRVIPQNSDVPVWAETYTHRMAEFVGRAKFIGDYADDLPVVDVGGREDTYKVKMFGVAYQYSLKEMQRSGRGLNLSIMRPRSARQAIEDKFNRLQWFGDPTAGLFGFLNFPFIPRYAVGVAFDATSDLLDILAEMNAIANFPNELTDTVAEPDTMLMPPAEYNYVATTPLADGSDTTILTHFLNNNPYINSVQNIQELKGAGPEGVNLIVVYRRVEENIQHKLVQPFTQLPAQQRNLATVVNCVAQSGGCVSDYPLESVIAELPA